MCSSSTWRWTGWARRRRAETGATAGVYTLAGMAEERPAPESFLDLVAEQRKGRLKIYVGAAAGVGKTYRMLEEAHELRNKGIDVVLGFVETHGRADTVAKVGDLEIVPRRKLDYRGVAAGGDGRRRDPRAQARGRDRRRTRAHQRRRLQA